MVIAFRWISAFAAVALLTAALTSGLLWRDGERRAGTGSSAQSADATSTGAVRMRCPHGIPRGATFETAWRTTAFFVTDVLMRENPVCGYDLSSKAMRGNLTRREWANGEGPVETFVTRYPAVPVAEASKDPSAPEAVYVLSRTVRDLVVSDARGRVVAPMKVGLFAPDAGMAAYSLELVLENGQWRVETATVVDLTMSDEPGLAGTTAEAG